VVALSCLYEMCLWFLALKGGVRCSPTCEEHTEGLKSSWGGLGGQLLGCRGGVGWVAGWGMAKVRAFTASSEGWGDLGWVRSVALNVRSTQRGRMCG
jgi:hypothetical protein